MDTSGAGDAFVGGFLAKYVTTTTTTNVENNSESLELERCIDDAIKCGNWASSLIIQKVGCNFSDIFPKKQQQQQQSTNDSSHLQPFMLNNNNN